MHGDPLRVLVVDDAPDAADSLAELLKMWGYNPEVRYDGPSALEAARLCPPAAVLLDLAMPGMHGFRFVELLRDIPGNAESPVIVLTAWPGEERRARAMRVAHYLLKPADPVLVRNLLEQVLRYRTSPVYRSHQPVRPVHRLDSPYGIPR